MSTATETKGSEKRQRETEPKGAVSEGPATKKQTVATPDGKTAAAVATGTIPDGKDLAQNAADAVAAAAKAAAPGAFVDPNIELSKMPGWFQNIWKEAELIFTADGVGARKGIPKCSLVYKGTKKLYQILTPAHLLATPHGPPYGDMTNAPMVAKMEATAKSDSKSKYVQGTPIGLNHRLDVPVAAWDTNLTTPEGEDPYCKEFVDVFLPELVKRITDFVFNDVSTQKPTPDLFEKIKAEFDDRWAPTMGVPKNEFLHQECLRAMMKGRPFYLPVNKETKEKLFKNRRVQLVAPVTKEQDKNKLRRTPPTLTTDNVMNQIYQHGFEYILYPIREAGSGKKLLTHEERKFNRGDVTAEYFTVTPVIHKDGSPPRYSIRFNWKSSVVFRRSQFESDEEKLDKNLKDRNFSSFVIVKPTADAAGAPKSAARGSALGLDTSAEDAQTHGFSEGGDDDSRE